MIFNELYVPLDASSIYHVRDLTTDEQVTFYDNMAMFERYGTYRVSCITAKSCHEFDIIVVKKDEEEIK